MKYATCPQHKPKLKRLIIEHKNVNYQEQAKQSVIGQK